jgi:hypothetical protein
VARLCLEPGRLPEDVIDEDADRADLGSAWLAVHPRPDAHHRLQMTGTVQAPDDPDPTFGLSRFAIDGGATQERRRRFAGAAGDDSADRWGRQAAQR